MTDTAAPPAPPDSPNQSITVAGGVIVAIVALYVGAGIFVPLVLAVLLTFALAPLVRFLHRLRLPHVAAVLLSVLFAVIVIGCLAVLIATQLARLTGELSQYQQIVSDKVRALQSLGGGDVFERIASAIQNIGASGTGAAGEAAPLPVTVVNSDETPLAYAQRFLGSLLGPLTTAAIVTVFVVFLLLEHGDFRDRFLKLVSRGDLRTSTKVVSEAGKRISRYLLVQFTVNMSYGLLFGTGLFLIGVPNPVLWGLFAALFRYIPFVGTLIAASIPFALAFAIDPGWGMLLSAVGLFVGLELVITNAIEPRLYGSSTGLSALAVIVAAMFWATLWGPIGLILSTPLTVCLVVLGRYVPQLRFLEILLGSEPVLVREEQLYQRLLSGNVEEAVDLGESYIAEHSTEAFFDDVALPALRLAEADRARSLTDIGSRRLIADGMAALVHEIEPDAADAALARGEAVEGEADVLCIGGRSELDGAAANMLAQLVNGKGIKAKVLPPISVRPEGLAHIDLAGVKIVCLAYLDPSPFPYARFVARRLKRRDATLRVIACFFNLPEPPPIDAHDPSIDAEVTSMTQARARVLALADFGGQAVHKRADPEPWRTALQSLISSKTAHEALIAEIKAEFGTSIAMLSLEEESLTEDALAPGAAEPAQASFATLGREVARTGAPLVVEDASTDAAHAEDAFLLVNDVHFYAGTPLLTPEGDTVGVLSILDGKARKFAATDMARLARMAEAIMARIAPAPPASDRKAGAPRARLAEPLA